MSVGLSSGTSPKRRALIIGMVIAFVIVDVVLVLVALRSTRSVSPADNPVVVTVTQMVNEPPAGAPSDRDR